MWLTLVPLILQILSALPGLIQEAEAAFGSKPGLGTTKKQFVLDAVGATLGVVKSTGKVNIDESHTDAILLAASTITDATVAALNAASVFKKPSVVSDPTKGGVVTGT